MPKGIQHGFCPAGKKDRLYACWSDMRQRCNNPKNSYYHRYGGRGIAIDPAWNDFSAFRTWALANGYDPTNHSLTIDRIDNNGNYTPANCRFTDKQTQALNKNRLSPSQKLTPMQALAIRRDPRTCAAIAVVYSVSSVLISKIKRRRVWKHI